MKVKLNLNMAAAPEEPVAVRVLSEGKKYHCSVLYNHYDGPSDRRDEDQILSSKMLKRLERELTAIGFPKVYHEGVFDPGTIFFDNLENMVEDAEKVVAILTQGYIKNFVHLYKEQTCLLTLIEQGNSRKFLPICIGLSKKELTKALGLTVFSVVYFNENWSDDNESWGKIKNYFKYTEVEPESHFNPSGSSVPVHLLEQNMSELQVDGASSNSSSDTDVQETQLPGPIISEMSEFQVRDRPIAHVIPNSYPRVDGANRDYRQDTDDIT